jgi:YVTN family beta-propeller protein
VTNAGSDNVSVIDTATHAVTATVKVGRNPLDVALTPDSSRNYVTNGQIPVHGSQLVTYASTPFGLIETSTGIAPTATVATTAVHIERCTFPQWDGIDGTNNLAFPTENELNGETALGLDGEKVFSPEKVVTRKTRRRLPLSCNHGPGRPLAVAAFMAEQRKK